MRQRRETVEHPFGTMKARMGATHFLTKTLPKVAAEMALSVLAYNLTRVMNIVGVKPSDRCDRDLKQHLDPDCQGRHPQGSFDTTKTRSRHGWPIA
jgi:Transposase DDE domain